MLDGEKILVTGPAGQIGFGLAETLARNNEVWGIARFSDPDEREKVEALGVTTVTIDLEDPDFGALPRDFTYLVHVAVTFDPEDYDRALRINAEGTGLLLSHCRGVKAALVMSTLSVYKPHPDPWHAFTETDPLGDMIAASPTYSVSKISQEAVARYCAREFGIPVTIARMGAAYSERGGLPVMHMRAIAAGEPARTRWDPCPYSPIHQDDINEQIEPLLAAASTPATIVNWCGDEAISVQEWAAYIGEVLGKPASVHVEEVPGASLGSVGDIQRRRALTGPCQVSWRDGFRRTLTALFPDEVKA
jgi:nucleoside-diphosphate-sugar epimerase